MEDVLTGCQTTVKNPRAAAWRRHDAVVHCVLLFGLFAFVYSPGEATTVNVTGIHNILDSG